MTFTDFAHRMGGVLQGADNQSSFTKSLFEQIVPDDRYDLLEDAQASTWKSYFNGNAQITRLAKKINACAEVMLFENYINEQEETAIQKLCDAFADELPDINMHNAGELIARLFGDIINNAAFGPAKAQEMQKKVQTVDTQTYPSRADLSLDRTLERIGSSIEINTIFDPFDDYIEKAVPFYSMKKTLLYAESPRPFYSMYVCNDLRHHSFFGYPNGQIAPVITEATVFQLVHKSNYSIIEGTGGIGKSMFMNHLFLSAAERYKKSEILPILVLLKEYKDAYPDLVKFIHRTIADFAPNISYDNLVNKLKNSHVVLLLDGLDEVGSKVRDSFDTNLESFIKGYPACSVILTSRPITDFVSYAMFNVFDIQPLRKEQAIELIKKLEFWDNVAKESFIDDLDNNLYFTHREFASNPLLLTIMLMTYSIHGDIPEKMHAFYAKAYETMARLHDATKGSFKRPFYTGLTPERFAVYFSEFCARTFIKEQLVFTKDSFIQCMEKVIANVPEDASGNHGVLLPSDFLRDLTDHLCIMYCEGENYYFIHRSFQEYFAAEYFIRDEEQLAKVGTYFEQQKGSFWHRMISMMYEMDADKVERFVFYPYLDDFLFKCRGSERNSYLGFLKIQYPEIHYNEGNVDDPELTYPDSDLYSFITLKKGLARNYQIDEYDWPQELESEITNRWVLAYRDYYQKESIDEEEARKDIEEYGGERILVREESLSAEYTRVFDIEDDIVGYSMVIITEDMLDNELCYKDTMEALIDESFPLYIEYQEVKKYYAKLKARVEKKRNAIGLFDD